MDEPQRHLHALDTETGELTDLERCPNCAALEDQLMGAENNVRSMRAQMANLKRELAGELDRDSALFPEAIALFRYWQERCDHPRAEFTPDRMKLLLPLLKRHGPAECREAIRGAAYDPFIVTYKNGTKHRHDGWQQIFAGEDKFQSFRERAPKYDGRNYFEKKSLVDTADEVFDRCQERARLGKKGDPVTKANMLVEIHRLIVRWQAHKRVDE